MKFFFGKYFLGTLLAVMGIELLSLIGYLHPLVNTLVFFVLLAITLIFSLIRLEYGILLLFAELFIGSKGYLFSFAFDGFSVSIRIAMFLVVMSVWLARYIATRKTRFLQTIFAPSFILLCVMLAYGVMKGFLKNDVSNVFFDANGWIYFALIFPTFDAITEKKQFSRLLQVFLASVTALIIKTFLLLYIFSHGFSELLYPLYKWVRDTGVGEITTLTPTFSRIFIQSHLFALIALFLAVGMVTFFLIKEKKSFHWIVLCIATLSVMILDFSRSFWVGGLSGAIVFFALLKKKLRASWHAMGKLAFFLLTFSLLAFGLVYGIGNFPYPKIEEGFNAWLLKDRFAFFGSEAALVSRWNLLPILMEGIKKAPIFGSGFGAVATYVSQDPRVLAMNPTGRYTTFAFEWGYFDIAFKIGFLGLFFYGIFLTRIFQSGLTLLSLLREEKERFVVVGLLSGYTALLGTHFWSPYLNHPLGIGLVILFAVIFQTLYDEKQVSTISE